MTALIPFGPIYPEFMVDREALKMEIVTGRGRTRASVLSLMNQYNQQPLEACLDCDKTCIQRKVVGLTKFECFKRDWK